MKLKRSESKKAKWNETMKTKQKKSASHMQPSQKLYQVICLSERAEDRKEKKKHDEQQPVR